MGAVEVGGWVNRLREDNGRLSGCSWINYSLLVSYFRCDVDNCATGCSIVKFTSTSTHGFSFDKNFNPCYFGVYKHIQKQMSYLPGLRSSYVFILDPCFGGGAQLKLSN